MVGHICEKLLYMRDQIEDKIEEIRLGHGISVLINPKQKSQKKFNR